MEGWVGRRSQTCLGLHISCSFSCSSSLGWTWVTRKGDGASHLIPPSTRTPRHVAPNSRGTHTHRTQKKKTHPDPTFPFPFFFSSGTRTWIVGANVSRPTCIRVALHSKRKTMEEEAKKGYAKGLAFVSTCWEKRECVCSLDRIVGTRGCKKCVRCRDGGDRNKWMLTTYTSYEHRWIDVLGCHGLQGRRW